jgi:hypothetical protein
MSWSVAAIGKAPAVRVSIAEQFKRNICAEPEETVRQAAAVTIDSALAAEDSELAVKVVASGSQGFRDHTRRTGVYNSLNISVEPQHGFVE